MKPDKKYIQIRHWDYWRGIYGCNGEAAPNAVEFSLTEDAAGNQLFFHFDFYNLPALRDTLRQGDFIGADHPDYTAFLCKTEDLAKQKIPYFIGGLYYRYFTPDLSFCNPPPSAQKRIADLLSPPAAPYYAVIFLAEENPLTPDVLLSWTQRLSQPLFGRRFFCEIANIPSQEDMMDTYWTES